MCFMDINKYILYMRDIRFVSSSNIQIILSILFILLVTMSTFFLTDTPSHRLLIWELNKIMYIYVSNI